jgi:hypothetical protein
MSDRQKLRFQAGMMVAIAAIVLLPAMWSLGSAVVSALSSGEVVVISVGRYETSHSLVPWRKGWARFVAPPILVLSLCLVAVSARGERRWWAGAALSVVGLALLFYSAWFSSAGGAAAFAGMSAFIALCAYVDRSFGRAIAFALMLATVLGLVFLYAPR